MIIKIKTDLFDPRRIEAIGVSDEDENVIQISTISGSTYEYAYRNVHEREQVMEHLESLWSQALCENVVKVIDPTN